MKKIVAASFANTAGGLDQLQIDALDALVGDSQRSLQESLVQTLDRGEYVITLPKSGGGGGMSVLIDAQFFIKFEYAPKEVYGGKYLRLSGENVPETVLVSLNRKQIDRMVAKKDEIKKRSIPVWEFLSTPFKETLSTLVLPFVEGKDFTEIEASFFNLDNIGFLGKELGRIIVKDMIFGVQDRMIGRTNPGNIMIVQDPSGLNTRQRLILIDNVFDVSKLSKRAFLIQQVKNFIDVASSKSGERDMALMPKNID